MRGSALLMKIPWLPKTQVKAGWRMQGDTQPRWMSSLWSPDKGSHLWASWCWGAGWWLWTVTAGRALPTSQSLGLSRWRAAEKAGRQWRSFGYLPLPRNQECWKFQLLHAGGYVKDWWRWFSTFVSSPHQCVTWQIRLCIGQIPSPLGKWLKDIGRSHKVCLSATTYHGEGHAKWLLQRPREDGIQFSPTRTVWYFPFPRDR